MLSSIVRLALWSYIKAGGQWGDCSAPLMGKWGETKKIKSSGQPEVTGGKLSKLSKLDQLFPDNKQNSLSLSRLVS